MKTNLTMLTDFYELTMANGYFENGLENTIAYFDMYFRKVPDQGGFAIMTGVEQLIKYLRALKFDASDIEYLRKKNMFCDRFLKYLQDFKFECDVWAVEEGMPIFPNEPIVTVRGPIIQAQFVETMILLTVNHQSLIATKANRIVRAADGRAVMEFGTRRAQGYDAAIYGARAAYIGGCAGTACSIAEKMYGIPALGTMAHSWIQLFDTEYEAFEKYAQIYPDNCTLLVDTYNVLKSGIPNAIKVHNELLAPMGKKLKGVRIDSGDMTYLSVNARNMLDDAGLTDCMIIASNALDEYVIRDILTQGAKIDMFGVGERLITSRSEPVFGGVYKLVAYERNGKIIPKIKLSENVAKITTPGFKKLYRLFSNTTGMALADVITTADEVIDDSSPYEIFDPEHTWKKKIIDDFTAVPLLVPLFEKGVCVYKNLSLKKIRARCEEQVNTLWDAVKRFENPHNYYVDLSHTLWEIKQRLMNETNI